MKRHLLLAVCVGIAAAFMPPSAAAQDLAMTAGKAAKVLLDNDKVRVIELHLAPGASTGMHSHGDNIVYFFTGGSVKQTLADGSTKDLNSKADEARWSGPVTHDSKNVGKTMSRVLVIELKEPMK